MNTQTQEDGGIQRIGWLAGTVGTLLLTSAGLELLAHQMFGQTDVDTLLWALYLGFWTYVLSIVGFLILSIRWLMDWRLVRANRVAMNRLFPTESKRRHLEKLEQEHPQFLQEGVASVTPSRSFGDVTARNDTNNLNRVA